MAEDTKAAWERFQADMNTLGAELKRQYRDAAPDSERTAELNRSLDQLRDAADKVFWSLETASRDPKVRSRTREAARSFGTALRQTFHQVGDEIEKALRTPAETKK
jgi:hypothetical protein